MDTHFYHTRGKGHSGSLHSRSHSAGRALSRTEARDRALFWNFALHSLPAGPLL